MSQLVERLEAVAIIISGNPDSSDLDMAYMELEEIIKSLDHFGHIGSEDLTQWKEQYNFPIKNPPTGVRLGW